MVFSRLRGTLRDARDILVHARSVTEVVRALGPPALRPPIVLNDAPTSTSAPTPDVMARLGALRRQLEAEILDASGRVDYAALRGSPAYRAITTTSAELATAPLTFASDAERIAFWINLYNILTIHGVVALAIRRSVMEVPSFFGRVAYRIGPHVLTLDDIENGVLRRNSPHPVTRTRQFGDGDGDGERDPRIALAPTRLEPRIHAALVCAARSCPPISMYDADRLDAQLALASQAFVNGGTEVDDPARTVTIPLVFRWYERDYGGAAGVRDFIVAHADPPLRDRLTHAFAAGYQLGHARYDWLLNSQ